MRVNDSTIIQQLNNVFTFRFESEGRIIFYSPINFIRQRRTYSRTCLQFVGHSFNQKYVDKVGDNRKKRKFDQLRYCK